MIRPRYAIKLARIKLRSKRGALIASIVISSLLFAALFATVIIFNGVEKSATEFVKKAGNDRYLVKATPNIPYEAVDFLNPPSLDDIRAIKAFEKKYYSELKMKYKSMGLEYNKKDEVPSLSPAAWASQSLPEEQRVTINWSSPVIEEMRSEKFQKYAETATNKFSDMKIAASKYAGAGYYVVEKQSLIPTIPSVRLVQNGKENFGDSDLETGGSTSYGYYVNAIHNGMYTFTDQKLLGRYLLTTDSANLKGVPVVVSAQEAVSLFGGAVGIGKEPEAASAKRAWLKEVQSKLNGQTYQACYRNTAEKALLEKIQQDYAAMKTNLNTEGYQQPHLIYDYPKGVCGDLVVKEDTRTALEKQSDTKSIETQKKLGTYVAPNHRLLTFQIVGIKYAQEYTDYSKGVSEYVKSLLVSQDESSSIDIPMQMYDALPNGLKVEDVQKEYGERTMRFAGINEDFATRVIEFTNVNDARAFLSNETCPTFQSSCDKKFKASPYGSNYLILDEIGKLFNRITSIAFPIALGLATVIIWFTISRIMAENRRETAVYRAMGAKRSDVAAIYILYVLLVGSWIALVSLTLGIAAAYAIDYFYGRVLTDIAVTAFGIVDDAPTFSLFNVQTPLLLIIISSIFIICIVASLQPLWRNVRRNPILDMRDDS